MGFGGGGGARVVAAYEMPRPCVRDVKQASLISLMAKNYTNIVQDSVLQHEVSRVRTVTTQDQSQKAKRDTLATRVDGPGYLDTCSKVNFGSGKTAEIGLTEMQYNGVCTSCSYAMHTLHIMHTTLVLEYYA